VASRAVSLRRADGNTMRHALRSSSGSAPERPCRNRSVRVASAGAVRQRIPGAVRLVPPVRRRHRRRPRFVDHDPWRVPAADPAAGTDLGVHRRDGAPRGRGDSLPAGAHTRRVGRMDHRQARGPVHLVAVEPGLRAVPQRRRPADPRFHRDPTGLGRSLVGRRRPGRADQPRRPAPGAYPAAVGRLRQPGSRGLDHDLPRPLQGRRVHPAGGRGPGGVAGLPLRVPGR
jgi:hypothetical protein